MAVRAQCHMGRDGCPYVGCILCVTGRVCKSGYPLFGYPDLSVNFMAAKNPDILMIDSRLLCNKSIVHFIQFLVLVVFTNFGVLKVHVSLSVPRIICDFE